MRQPEPQGFGWWDDEEGSVGAMEMKKRHREIMRQVRRLEREAPLSELRQRELDQLQREANEVQRRACAGDFRK